MSWIAAAKGIFRRWGRWALLIGGTALLLWLVSESGFDEVAAVLNLALPFVPLVITLEMLWAAIDIFALRCTYGPAGQGLPLGAWLRSAAVAYAVMIIFPAGRAGGEIARASMLSRQTSVAICISSALSLQVAVLWGNTAISIACGLAALTVPGPLAYLVLGNGLATFLFGVGILRFGRRSWGTGLAHKFGASPDQARTIDQALGDANISWRAVGLIVVGRVVQTIQYGVILLAVSASFTPLTALVAQGIHLVGAGLGDFVPNAVGITEAAYRALADSLDMQANSAQAISIPLLARLCQFALAALCLLLTTLTKGPVLSTTARGSTPLRAGVVGETTTAS